MEQQMDCDLVTMCAEKNTSNMNTDEKKSSSNAKIFVSAHAHRNGRRKLEDRHVVENDLNTAFDLDLPHKYRYYAIFDGHVNDTAAEFCKNKLHLNLIQNDNFKNGNIQQALKETFRAIDQEYCASIANQSAQGGTTALVCLIQDDHRVFIAWAGDSCSMIARNKQPQQLTIPHSPEIESERARITDLGGQCVNTDIWRVNGILAVSRSIGDADFKPYVTAEPDVIEFDLDGSEDFIVFHSDGLTDGLTYEEVSSIIYNFVLLNSCQYSDIEIERSIAAETSEVLSKHSIAGGSSDNITSIVVYLKNLSEIYPRPDPNAHQNGHHTNGHHIHQNNEQLLAVKGENEEICFTEQQTNSTKPFALNVNANSFSPNLDILNNISMSGIESIRNLQKKAWDNNHTSQDNINVTSNEENVHDESLQCAINDQTENSFDKWQDDEQPHSILSNINDRQNDDNNAVLDSKSDMNDEDIDRELDDERVVMTDENIENRQLDELEDEDEDENVVADEEKDVDEDGQENEMQQEKTVVNENIKKEFDLEDDSSTVETIRKTVECEYSIIPSESIASPVDLISEQSATIADQHEIERRDSNDNLSNSPFEQLVETPQQSAPDEDEENVFSPQNEHSAQFDLQKEIDQTLVPNENQTADIETIESVQQVEENQSTTAHEPQEEKSEDNSFVFLEISQPSDQDQNSTHYESPENSDPSKMATDFQGEFSVYENANTNFESSILNRDLQYRELQNQDDEHDDEAHPFENDSEDSIKFLDKTTIEQKTDQAFDAVSGESLEPTLIGRQSDVDDLADLMTNANINDNTSMNENQTLNLLEDTRYPTEHDENEENICKMNKENVPQQIVPPMSNLLDSTLVVLDQPNLLPSQNVESVYQTEQIDEDDFDREDELVESRPMSSSNFELIKSDELNEDHLVEANKTPNQLNENFDDQTNYRQLDMDLTYCNIKPTEINASVNKVQEMETTKADSLDNDFGTDKRVPCDEQISSQETHENLLSSEPHMLEQQDITIQNNHDESNSEYIQASQDPSFIRNLDQLTIDQTPIVEQSAEEHQVDEQAVLESKDSFVVIESPEVEATQENDQSHQSRLHSENIESQSNENLSSVSNKPEVIDETPKEVTVAASFSQPDESIVPAAPAVIAATTLAVATGATALSSAMQKKPASTTSSTKSQPLKLTKDTKLVVKDSKSTTSKLSSKDVKPSSTTSKSTNLISKSSTLTKKPLTTASASLNKPSTTSTRPSTTSTRPSTTSARPSSTVASATTRKPLSKPAASTTSAVSSSRLLSKKPAASSSISSKSTAAAARPSTLTSRVSSIASKPVASRLTTASTASSKPLTKTTTTLTKSSSLASKASVPSKTIDSRSKPSSLKTTNATSRVSSGLASSARSTAPRTALSTASSTAATKSTLATKKPLSSTLSSRLASKPSTTTTNSSATASSKTSSIRSAGSTSAQSKLNSRTSGSITKSTVGKSSLTTTNSVVAAKKTTAVPRKPSNGVVSTSKTNGIAVEQKTTINENGFVDDSTINHKALDQSNENSNSIKPNSQIMNGQSTIMSNGNSLSNGDGPVHQALSSTTTSITSSKSRDKLTTSLKAEIEAALEATLPK